MKNFTILVLIMPLFLINTIKAESKDNLIQIAITGDIMMGTTFPSKYLPPDNGKNLFVDVTEHLTKADLALGNLEGTLFNEGDTLNLGKKVKENSYAFCTPTDFTARLNEAGFDFLSLANNHINDFGIEGMKSTMKALDSIGIKYAGIRGLCESTIIIKNGIRFGVCAFGHNHYTVRHINLENVKRVIDNIKANCDLLIISFHGGAEGSNNRHLPYGKEIYYEENRGSLRELAHFCIDNGADIVYGHGPHVVRAIELYKNKFIAYSLGNFCTPYGFSLKGRTKYSPIILLNIDKKGNFIKGKIHSFIQTFGKGPRNDKNHNAAKEIRDLTFSDIPRSLLYISKDGNITKNL